ncbi:hypothetical protein KCH_14490 [Kitasatospora cheerisanensis KCTC 2395]|uniref:Methyltransferase n=1 Tax=Kitasatospora cheerisanensis KCTC 2395 TaxID=1348663 RepID=A0A066Z3K2_9ACTN|nr:hypothetical protein KCH_14490 [Kitasatospora cheerisanensis KCTC 2395]
MGRHTTDPGGRGRTRRSHPRRRSGLPARRPPRPRTRRTHRPRRPAGRRPPPRRPPRHRRRRRRGRPRILRRRAHPASPRVRPRTRSAARRLLGGRRLRPGRHALGGRPGGLRARRTAAPRRQRLPRPPQGRRPHHRRRRPQRTRPDAPRRAPHLRGLRGPRHPRGGRHRPHLRTRPRPRLARPRRRPGHRQRPGHRGRRRLDGRQTRRPPRGAARLGPPEPGVRRRGRRHPAPRALPPHVRALALARLAPAPGDLLWTVGAGDGALAVEAARFGAAVVAVEAEPADCARITANARRAGVEIETATGSGPEVLGALPEPDAVAVEHGGPAMVRAVVARKPERVVAVARSLAEAGETRQILDAAGYRTDGLLLQSAPLRAEQTSGAGPSFGRGDYTLLIWAEPHD